MKFKDCKEFERIPVIYGIKNIVTNKWYIGSCVDMKDRFQRHNYYLKNNNHHSLKLQRSYNIYGEDSFEIDILKKLKEQELDNRMEIENQFIQKYNSIKMGYNMIPANPSYSFKQTNEAKIKAAKSHMIKVVCINRFTNELYKIYNSLTEAAKDLGLETTNISSVCMKKRVRYLKNFVFRYLEDYNPDEDYRVINGVPKSEEWKLKARLNSAKAKKVYKYDLQNNLICEYTSRAEAERQNNFKKEFLRCRIDKVVGNYIYSHKNKDIV